MLEKQIPTKLMPAADRAVRLQILKFSVSLSQSSSKILIIRSNKFFGLAHSSSAQPRDVESFGPVPLISERDRKRSNCERDWQREAKSSILPDKTFRNNKKWNIQIFRKVSLISIPTPHLRVHRKTTIFVSLDASRSSQNAPFHFSIINKFLDWGGVWTETIGLLNFYSNRVVYFC